MKRSLLIAAAAATAVALLAGCSTSTTEEAADPKPSASAETNPSNPPRSEAPEGSDPKLVAFNDTAEASCNKVLADGGIATSKDVKVITVPKTKSIDKATDVAIVSGTDGKVIANYIIGPEPRTGEPMPFVCSISSAAYVTLMNGGDSARFNESGGVWTWTQDNMTVAINVKNDVIDSFTQTVLQGEEKVKMDYALTYGLSAADLKLFADAVNNPTKPPVAPAPSPSPKK